MPHTLSSPDQWVDLYADDLFCYALKFIAQHDQAQNAVQEALYAALKGKDSFSGKSSEKTWLIGILKHKITDLLRVKYREIPASQLVEDNMHIEQFFDAATDSHLSKEPGHWEFDPTALLENTEFWAAYNECLSRLPEKTAQAFSLREMDGMPSEEICKVLGIAPTNLWVLLHRARLQLRQCLEINWFEQGK